MTEPLENLYFNWLYAKVTINHNSFPYVPYYRLLGILHSTEFVWLLSGDDNRAEDGKELRTEFILMAEIPDNPGWRHAGCSVLEMLIAFARRAEFTTDISVQDWFWEFIANLGLKPFNDLSEWSEQEVEDILEQFIWRTYLPHGEGGLFPIEHPHKDQRNVEIWYQFCDYLVDQDRLP